jgi:hypothetical protein
MGTIYINIYIYIYYKGPDTTCLVVVLWFSLGVLISKHLTEEQKPAIVRDRRQSFHGGISTVAVHTEAPGLRRRTWCRGKRERRCQLLHSG